MKIKFKTYLIVVVAFICTSAFAQNEPKMIVALLANDKISAVNLDQDKFINYLAIVSDVIKKDFKEIPETQKIAFLLVSHKSGKPTVELYSNPEINSDLKASFLKDIDAITIENTKIVDFPILFVLNTKLEAIVADFKDFVSPVDKQMQEYSKAGLKEKYELNKEYAVEVLSVLSAYQVIVDKKFEGVINFGKSVSDTDFKAKQDISKMTSKNYDYWRAVLEMSVGDELIPITKVFMLVSQGEFDHAIKYIEIIRMFSDPESISDYYMKELLIRLNVFNKQLELNIQDGIRKHDKGEYDMAIEIYNEILKEYPNSAWTKYELYYSQNALDLKNGGIDSTDRMKWDIAKKDIYKSNPLYNMDVRASTGREGYLLFRRQSISDLFKENTNRVDEIYKYADIAMDLGVYDFAAQLFWYTTFYKTKQKDNIMKFMYCADKLGITKLRETFIADFDKEFKKIEKQKEKEMVKSKIYKSFKNK